MGQHILLARNWLEHVVLEWKTVFSCVRLIAYKSQSEEQNLNRLIQTSHYAKPEHDLTHPKNIYLSKPRLNKDF